MYSIKEEMALLKFLSILLIVSLHALYPPKHILPSPPHTCTHAGYQSGGS